MSTAAAAAPAAPKPPKPRKPRPPAEKVDCDRCGIEISKSRLSNHQQTLSCARRAYTKRCSEMMRERGYVPVETYQAPKLWRLLPEEFREIGPAPQASASREAEVAVWVKEELGVVVNGAVRAHLDEKLLYRIAHVAAVDPELRAAMGALFIMSPKEAFYQGRGYYDPVTHQYKHTENPERQALIEGLAQWVGDWECVNLPDEVEKD